ncbi:MAG: kynureninase [Geminicoccaceae bacterium]
MAGPVPISTAHAPGVFERTKRRFRLPEGVIYLDGNSLGPLPDGVAERLTQTVEKEWGGQLIRAWNEADWIDLPAKIGDRITKLIGAEPGSVVVADSTSINLYKALAAALQLQPERQVILSDSGNFPTDLHMAEGLIASLGAGHHLEVVAPEEVEGALDDRVAALMLTEVDYRTGRLHDMRALTRAAHAVGALAIWDLAHSAGALPVDLAGCRADFAVGCGYKYLNGGPGAPAFIYVRPDYAERIEPALSGWMGHEAPFAFGLHYHPASGSRRMRVGTPPILSLAALDVALDVWDDIDIETVRTASIALANLLIREVERRCDGYGLTLVSPRDGDKRGSQVSFRFDEGYAAMQALIASGVIGDFRAPDLMRFGITPLYIGEAEIIAAAERLEAVLKGRLWDRPEFKTRAKVT